MPKNFITANRVLVSFSTEASKRPVSAAMIEPSTSTRTSSSGWVPKA